jgi:hypothetical protein
MKNSSNTWQNINTPVPFSIHSCNSGSECPFLSTANGRHTIGFARNEMSRRYVDSPPEIWSPNEFRQRDPKIKQGSKPDTVEKNDEALQLYTQTVETSVQAYHALMELGVAPEMVRTVLPLGLYTEFIETGSLTAYARLCKLRPRKKFKSMHSRFMSWFLKNSPFPGNTWSE